MKKIFCVVAFFSAILIISCSKISNKAKITSLTSVKKWVLTETLADPVDGSGKRKPVNKQYYYFIKFNTDGLVKTNTYTGSAD